jgi:hypothetical protein
LSWTRLPEPAIEDSSADAEDYVWRPAESADRLNAATDIVSCRVAASQAGARDVEISYLMTGLAWRVKYEVMLRGEVTNEEERVSMDLEGTLVIDNQTELALAQASVRVVGAESEKRRSDLSASGFLMVEDSPLADLWVKKPVENPVAFLYEVPGAVRIRPRARTEVALVKAERRPAERRYFMRAGDYPMNRPDLARPLTRRIVVEHAALGIGAASIPAGPVTVFLGGMRSTLSESAWFDRTSAGGSLRLDVGPADAILGSRVYTGRRQLAAGFYDDSYAFVIENRLPAAVTVEIEEEPGTSLEWEIASANAEVVVRGRRAHFTATAPGEGRAEIRYTLRVRELSI